MTHLITGITYIPFVLQSSFIIPLVLNRHRGEYYAASQ